MHTYLYFCRTLYMYISHLQMQVCSAKFYFSPNIHIEMLRDHFGIFVSFSNCRLLIPVVTQTYRDMATSSSTPQLRQLQPGRSTWSWCYFSQVGVLGTEASPARQEYLVLEQLQTDRSTWYWSYSSQAGVLTIGPIPARQEYLLLGLFQQVGVLSFRATPARQEYLVLELHTSARYKYLVLKLSQLLQVGFLVLKLLQPGTFVCTVLELLQPDRSTLDLNYSSQVGVLSI